MHVPGTCILICELLCCFSGPMNYPSVSQQIQIEYAPSAPATITTHFNNNNMNLHVVPPPVALPPQSAPALQASAAATQQVYQMPPQQQHPAFVMTAAPQTFQMASMVAPRPQMQPQFNMLQYPAPRPAGMFAAAQTMIKK